MPTICCVPNCSSNHSKYGPYVSVFRFPSNDRVKSYWEKAIGNNFKAHTSSRICIKHFEDKHLCGTRTNSRVLLKRNAVPTLLMPKLIFEEPYLTFEYLSKNYRMFIKDTYYHATVTDDLVCFYKIDFSGVPTITSSIKIFNNMEFQVFKNGNILLRNLNLSYIRVDEKEQLLYLLKNLETFEEDEEKFIPSD